MSFTNFRNLKQAPDGTLFATVDETTGKTWKTTKEVILYKSKGAWDWRRLSDGSETSTRINHMHEALIMRGIWKEINEAQ